MLAFGFMGYGLGNLGVSFRKRTGHPGVFHTKNLTSMAGDWGGSSTFLLHSQKRGHFAQFSKDSGGSLHRGARRWPLLPDHKLANVLPLRALHSLIAGDQKPHD